MIRVTTWALAAILSIGSLSLAQQPNAPGEAADEARDRKVMERFLTVLEKTPRRGTALDRVYGYNVERGTLDPFLKTYRERVAADPNDGASWLILGLVEAQRGKDAAAVEALKKAEAARADDPLPSYYVGQAQILVGQPDAAADSFERALARKPSRADLLDIYQALGRVHQRAHRNDRALAVWDRLEKAFPDDPRVQEQIAHALADESQDAAALGRFEALAKGTKDRFRQVQFALEAAELKVRLGKSSDALADFENLLGKLDPESWLYREVRRKVEDVFLRTDDLAGLASYYDRWIKKVPDDVEAMARLGRTLANQGRVADARKWFDQAVKLAPSRRELRLALIEQLTQERNYAEAASQYESLAKLEPNNPDVVRDWGRMLLRDASKAESDRKKAAAAVWKRLAPDDARDAVAIAQAADLYRQAGLSDEAIAFYQRAIKLAPEASQYREYLGEYYHVLKRPADALATWRQAVEGSKRNAKTLGRLGEVLAGFGYRTEAVEPMVEACKFEPDDFDLRLRLADLRLTLEQPAEALVELDKASNVAAADEQAEAVLDRQIKAYQASNTLGARIEALQQEVEARPTAIGWTRLARLLEADGKPPEAARAIVEATKIDPKSVPAWVATARLRELAGDLLGSVQALRTLTTIDRRSRTDYLMGIAKLESRLGRRLPALEAGRELLAAAPGNADNHQFFAELCFSLGEPDEGLDSLRRAARANPSDPKAMLTLAENLARQFRTEEAIELYWRAFAKTTEVDGKLSIVARLADQYLQRNQLDRLFARLERELREPNQSRELSLCLAQAHAASGDFATARLELERLLASSPRDIHLLGQLSSMAEQEGDFLTAAKYQKQAVDIASSTEGIARLAQLYVRSGEYLEAEAIWTKSTEGQDPGRSLSSIDSLLTNGKRDAVLQVTGRLLRDRPDDWELLYREGVALAGLNRVDEADQRFQKILALKGADDDRSVLSRGKGPGNSNRPAGTQAAASSTSPNRIPNPPIMLRINTASQAAAVAGVTSNMNANVNMNMGTGFSFIPQDFGQGRVGALAWRYGLAQRVNAHEAFVKKVREDRDKAGTDPRALWDWYYLQLIRMDNAETAAAATSLVKRLPTDLASQYVYLSSMANRSVVPGQAQVFRPVGSTAPDPVPALPAEEIERMLASYRGYQGRRPDLSPGVLNTVLVELKRANRTKDADAAYREAMDAAAPGSLYAATLLSIAAERSDIDGMLAYLDKLEKAPLAGLVTGPGTATPLMVGQLHARTIALRAASKAYPEMLATLDRFLTWNTNSRAKPKPGASPSASSSQANQARQNGNYVLFYPTAQRAQNAAVDFPTAGDRMGVPALTVLRTTFEAFRKDDSFGDLASHLQTRVDESSGPEKIDRLLALGILRWWNDEKDEAAAAMAEAAQLAGPDASVRMMLAELLERRNDLSEALAAIDAIESVDTATVQKRENQALRLAVATGNVQRARLAAERLFGLRLDAEAQVNLAALMHQLGMHDLAEAVLARARKTAGNKPPSLLVLMNQYQKQDKPELALQLALQILRLRPTNSAATNPQVVTTNGMMINQGANEDDFARQQAIQVLSRSGKLKELIARAEGQLERSPNSMAVLQSLAEYARVANDKEKTKALYERMAKTRPDDAKLRLQVAYQLVQSGEAAASLDHFRAAIKSDPTVIASQFNAIFNGFRQANKADEFSAIVEGIDLRAVGNTSALMNITQYLSNDPTTKGRAQVLFQRIWATFPGDRATFLAYLNNNEEWWRLPEVYSYAKETVLPAPGAGMVGPWSGIDRVQYYGNDGRVFTLANRLIDTAASQNRLDPFAKEIRESLVNHPEWVGGKALLTVVLLRLEKFEEARSLVKEFLATAKEPPMTVRLLIGQELEDQSQVQDLAGEIYEAAARDFAAKPTTDINNNMSPSVKLLAWYRSAGRMDECRDLIIKLARTKAENSPYDAAYTESQRINMMQIYAQQLTGMGFPADAVSLYREQIAAVEAFSADPMSTQYVNKDWTIQNAQQGIRQTLVSARSDMLAPTVASLFRPIPGTSKAGPGVDLFVSIPSTDFEKNGITSTLAEAFEKLVGKKSAAVGSSSNEREIASGLATILEKNPDDLATNIAIALYAFAEGNADEIDRSTARLATLVEKTPLEEIKASKATRGKVPRPNARQRAEAFKQVDLWLVARSCWTRESTRSKGDLFASRAVEAARRQADTRWPAIMLRDWGQSALDRGDRLTAERRWAELLELVIPPLESPRAEASDRARASLVSFQAQKPPTIPATPKEEFDKAMILARMAAERKMTELSIRAVREAFRGGSPVGVQPGIDASNAMVNTNNPNGFVTTRTLNGVVRNVRTNNVNQDAPPDQTLGQIQASLFHLETIWSRNGAPLREVYEVLRDIVLPKARPGDVNLYAAPLNQAAPRHPRSTSARLAAQAVKVGAIEELREAAKARRGNLIAELSAVVLMTQIGLEARDVPATVAALDQIEAWLHKDSLRVSSELAAIAALPSLGVEGATKSAEAVLAQAIANLVTQSGTQPISTLSLVLAGIELDHGRLDEARKRFQTYLDVQDKTNAQNTDPSFLAFRKRQSLVRVASEYAIRGIAVDGLEFLGRYADVGTTRYQEVPPHAQVALIARALEILPALDRYRLMLTWTMPTAERKSIRLLTTSVPASDTPSDFERLGGAKAGGVFSSLDVLIAAAMQAGKLDELIAEATKLDGEKLEEARSLLILARIAKGGANEVRSMVEAMADEVGRPEALTPTGIMSRPTGVYLVARGSMANPAIQPSGVRLAEAFQARMASQNWQIQSPQMMMLAQLKRELVESRAARAAGRPWSIARDPGLACWVPATSGLGGSLNQTIRPAWSEHEGHVALFSPSEPDSLAFVYPMSGSFELSVETAATLINEGGAELAFGGQSFGSRQGANMNRSGSLIFSPNNARAFKLEGSNRITLRFDGAKVTCLVNGLMVSEESDPSPTSPWLMLTGTGRASWRVLELRGSPTIPREVRLTQGDRLEGWSSMSYGASVAPRSSAFAPGQEAASLDAYDWASRDGVIKGRKIDDPTLGEDIQSHLAYARPLLDGESISYEFFHEAGITGVHPSLGRLAFLVAEDGVKLHWMTENGGPDASGLKPGNVVDDPAGRIGNGLIPLKASAWNLAKLFFAQGKVVLELNGEPIYQRSLGATNDRVFGLFHFKDRTSVRVRDVALRGDWPTSIDAARSAGLLARRKPSLDEAESRVDHALVGEADFTREAEEVLKRTRLMPGLVRFEELSRWVLPGPTHSTFRLQGSFTPLDPAPAALVSEGTSPVPFGHSRVHVGGEPESPAADLVEVARELGRLDDLAAKVEAAKVIEPLDARGRLSLLSMIRLAQGKEEEAVVHLTRLAELGSTIRTSDADWSRWPELMATRAGVLRPRVRAAAMATLPLVKAGPDQTLGATDVWVRQVRHARSIGEAADKNVPFGEDPGIAGWTMLTRGRAVTRGSGYPRSSWIATNGEWAHDSGAKGAMLLFKTPLRGDFEASCDLAISPGRETLLSYAGVQVMPTNGGQVFSTQVDDLAYGSISLSPPLEIKGDWLAWKLTVREAKLTITLNSRLVYDKPIATECDPWLAIYASWPDGGAARNFKLTGNPTIPERLRLSGTPEWTGWTATEYDESTNNPGNTWRKRGDEIVGPRAVVQPNNNFNDVVVSSVTRRVVTVNGSAGIVTTLPTIPMAPSTTSTSTTVAPVGSTTAKTSTSNASTSLAARQESMLRYRRPIVDDGVIEYEFYYEPSKVMVHPSLDRLAFLITPDGVTLHRTTDAAHDRVGLEPGNETVEPSCRRGPASLPIRPKAWNRLKLSVTGNTVAITVNDVLAYERPIETTNQRCFGLFHYADETEARVRNVTYRGDWPKVLPK